MGLGRMTFDPTALVTEVREDWMENVRESAYLTRFKESFDWCPRFPDGLSGMAPIGFELTRAGEGEAGSVFRYLIWKFSCCNLNRFEIDHGRS